MPDGILHIIWIYRLMQFELLASIFKSTGIIQRDAPLPVKGRLSWLNLKEPVEIRDGLLYVADTYNSKIKVIDPAKRSCKTFLGDGAGWLADSIFNEPGGLSFAGDKLYVADTNSHRIRVVDMKTKAVSTLKLQEVKAPKLAAATP